MKFFADGRKDRGSVGYRKRSLHPGLGSVSLVCLLALVGVFRAASAAIAEDDVAPASTTADDAAPLDLSPADPENSPVPVRTEMKPKAVPASYSEGLETETERPEAYQKIVGDSAYPPTDIPEKLTAEQLDAIAKLAPKANKAGLQVHPAMVPLFRSMVLHYTGGTYKNAPLRFRLHTPEPYQEGKRYPMVVWLHGAGECGDDNVNQLSHLHHMIPSLVGPKKRDFFLLVPQCPHSNSAWEAPEICSTTVRPDGTVECHVTDDPVAVGSAPIAYTLAMVDAVIKEFPVDTNRVTVAGLSTGGDGTWRILERRPDLFAAAVPIVSWQALHDKSLRENPILKKIPIWAIYSSDDHGIDFARKEFDRVRDRGCLVFKTEFGVCGHRAWTPAMLQGDVFGWLISRAKDGHRYFAAEASPTDPAKIGIFADVTEGDLKRVPTKAGAKPKPAAEATAQPAVTAAVEKAKEEADAKRPASGGMGGWNTAGPMLTSQPAMMTTAPPGTVVTTVRPGAATTSQPFTTSPTPSIVPAGTGPAFNAGPAYGYSSYPNPSATSPGASAYASTAMPYAAPNNPSSTSVEQLRLELVMRCIASGDVKRALAVADKVKNREQLIRVLLQSNKPELLAYVDRELDRMEAAGPSAPAKAENVFTPAPTAAANRPAAAPKKPLEPIPANKKSPQDECGKQWAMSPTTLYGLFPNGWDQESARVPAYVLNETGVQLRDRLAKAFAEDDRTAMKEFCDSFIRLDDIPLSSPWFDTSGGRLQGRIVYSLNEKAKPVVELLREIATVKAESKKDLAELAQKSLDRIDAIVRAGAKE
jgi:pimeloyl-ACP methyl ester carboxylesterase